MARARPHPTRAQDEFAQWCVELLQTLGPCTARRMFGGHGLFLDGLMVGLIAGERLYLKADAHARAIWQAAGSEPFVYEGGGRRVEMSYWSAPPEAMDGPAQMAPWARLALEAALRSRAQAANRPRARAAASAPPARVAQTSRTRRG
ncbi:MAG: hypothetical protein KatS3mg122_1132 [Caldimonas sp.]|nr:MAG: hypothetical protein KatS3mg122_1132 [Caldimonas sp.]